MFACPQQQPFTVVTDCGLALLHRRVLKHVDLGGKDGEGNQARLNPITNTVCIDKHHHICPPGPPGSCPWPLPGIHAPVNVKTKLLPPLACEPALVPQRSTKTPLSCIAPALAWS